MKEEVEWVEYCHNRLDTVSHELEYFFDQQDKNQCVNDTDASTIQMIFELLTEVKLAIIIEEYRNRVVRGMIPLISQSVVDKLRSEYKPGEEGRPTLTLTKKQLITIMKELGVK